MLRALAPYLGYSYLSLVRWTTRLSWRGLEHLDSLEKKKQGYVQAFWHNRQVYFTCSHRDRKIATLVSQSRDGAVIAKVMALSRIEAPRGSSSRGASAALLQIIDLHERGFNTSFTPDGPKGPVYQVKPGVLFIAQKLKIPILPVINAISNKVVLKRSWDQFQVPLPFGRAVVRYGRPIWVREDDDLAAKAAELKEELDRITVEADAEVAR